MKQRFQRLLMSCCLAGMVVASLPTQAAAYVFWQFGAGRQERLANYDLPGYAWGADANATYPFDWSISYPAGWTQEHKNLWRDAIRAGMQEWTTWASVSVGAVPLANGGRVRVEVVPGTHAKYDAFTTAYTDSVNTTYTEVTYYAGNTTWYGTGDGNAAHITTAARHEFGHVLGLHDLYPANNPNTEEFVDHRLAGNDLPMRQPPAHPEGYDDSAMYFFSDSAVIDNDEIAAATWLWGGAQDQSQIVCGGLDSTWNAANDFYGRNVIAHHGDQEPLLGAWVYLGSVGAGSPDQKPRIALDFPGYADFLMESYPAATWTHIDGADDWEIFECNQAGWEGNFKLQASSTFTNERYANAWITGGGRVDDFDQAPRGDGLAFVEPHHWAQIFGPIPEPGTLALMLVVGLPLLRRHRRH